MSATWRKIGRIALPRSLPRYCAEPRDSKAIDAQITLGAGDIFLESRVTDVLEDEADAPSYRSGILDQEELAAFGGGDGDVTFRQEVS